MNLWNLIKLKWNTVQPRYCLWWQAVNRLSAVTAELKQWQEMELKCKVPLGMTSQGIRREKNNTYIISSPFLLFSSQYCHRIRRFYWPSGKMRWALNRRMGVMFEIDLHRRRLGINGKRRRFYSIYILLSLKKKKRKNRNVFDYLLISSSYPSSFLFWMNAAALAWDFITKLLSTCENNI